LRIVTALLLLQHGTAKLFGFRMSQCSTTFNSFAVGHRGRSGARWRHSASSWHLHPPGRFHFVRRDGGCIFYRACAKSFFPILNQGELAVLYCFVLFISPWRAGRGSLTRDSHAAFHLIEQPMDEFARRYACGRDGPHS
jgi:putative oxidoreductase